MSSEEKVDEETPVEDKSEKNKRKWDIVTKTSVEPCVFLFSLGFAFINIQMPTLYIQKTCNVGSYFFGNQTYSTEICDNLFNGSFDAEQKIVQAADSKVQIVARTLNTIPMVVFSLFLGPWSDTVGRKMLLTLSLLGSVLLCVCFIINVYFFDELVVEFLWIESLSYCFGGYTVFFLGAYGYIADTTSLKSRTIRIAVMDGLFAVAEGIGNFINVYIYAQLGHYGNFGFASASFLLGIIIVHFKVQNKERVHENDKKVSIFDWKNVLESFKALTKSRPDDMRHIVIILVICYEIEHFGFGGLTHVDYLYLRRKFDWSDENVLVQFYTQLLSYKSAINTFSLFVILPLSVKVFKLHDMSISMLAYVACIIKCLIYCFSDDKNILYSILGIALFDTLCAQPVRSSLTKIVGSDEAGKVLAAVGSIQAVMGFSAPIFNYIYLQSLDTYIGTVFLVIAGLYVLILALSVYTWLFLKKESAIFSAQEAKPYD